MSDRYENKPFLRFVDAWVLKAIGHLDQATEAYCTAMEPQLHQSFNTTGRWPEIVAKQMNFTPSFRRRSARYGPTARRASRRGTARRPTPCSSR